MHHNDFTFTPPRRSADGLSRPRYRSHLDGETPDALCLSTSHSLKIPLSNATMRIKDELFLKHQDSDKRLSLSAGYCAPALEVLNDRLDAVNTVIYVLVGMSHPELEGRIFAVAGVGVRLSHHPPPSRSTKHGDPIIFQTPVIK